MISKTTANTKDYEHLRLSKQKIQTLLDYFNESKRRKELAEEAAKVLIKFKKMCMESLRIFYRIKKC